MAEFKRIAKTPPARDISGKPVYEIWHKDSADFRENDVLTLNKVFPAGWTKVATVRPPAGVHQLFELTNHIHENWLMGEHVRETFVRAARSTSVGDIYVNREAGKAWTVNRAGLTEWM